MEITELINQPKRLNRDTLYELRSTLALHPYFQTARLLMLHNLYLLHDPSFDEELRRAAIYISDRKAIFNMVEAAHYQLRKEGKSSRQKAENTAGSRTVDLIDTFLDALPKEEEEPTKKKRRPTPADAAVDYVAYLMETESEEEQAQSQQAPQMKRQDLIDTFLEQERGHILLGHLSPTTNTDDEDNDDSDAGTDEEYFTETLARIYIKQGRYQKALDIIGRLSTQHPHKNAYFADQIRFLEKLIINNNNKQK